MRLACPCKYSIVIRGTSPRPKPNYRPPAAKSAASNWSCNARLTEAISEYASASQQVRRYVNEILPDAKQSLEIVQVGYEQGEFGYLEILTAQRTYFRVKLAYVESLREYWINRVRIEGMLMTGGLQTAGL